MSSPTGTNWTPRNWGAACAILTGSLVTLSGIAIELEPETILLRSAVACVAVGLIVTWTARLLHSITTSPPEPED